MSEEDRAKTAFCTQVGLIKFRVMSFGLCDVPTMFQHLMDLVLAGAKWSTYLVYLDDSAIVGRMFQEHLGNVQDVLDKLRQAGLHLKLEKCFVQEEVNYLGHVMSENSLVPGRPSQLERGWPGNEASPRREWLQTPQKLRRWQHGQSL